MTLGARLAYVSSLPWQDANGSAKNAVLLWDIKPSLITFFSQYENSAWLRALSAPVEQLVSLTDGRPMRALQPSW
jgi:hypothetical protein